VTGYGDRWTRERVTSLRSHYHIAVYKPADDGIESSRPRGFSRQYNAADPANRLVAGELEARWNKVVPALVKPETIDQLLSGINPADLASPGVFRQLKKAIIELALGAELSVHLGYPKGDAKPVGQTNQRNGTSAKRILTDEGVIDLDVPRDRNGSFEPQLVEKGQRRFHAGLRRWPTSLTTAGAKAGEMNYQKDRSQTRRMNRLRERYCQLITSLYTNYSFTTRRNLFIAAFSDSYTCFTPSPSEASVTRIYFTSRSKPTGSTDAA
jgi:putative transposase